MYKTVKACVRVTIVLDTYKTNLEPHKYFCKQYNHSTLKHFCERSFPHKDLVQAVSRRVVPAPLSSRFGGEGSLSEEMKMKETQFCSWSVCISQHQTCKGFNKKRELGRAPQSSKEPRRGGSIELQRAPECSEVLL